MQNRFGRYICGADERHTEPEPRAATCTGPETGGPSLCVDWCSTLTVMEVLIVLFLTLWFLSEVKWERGASTGAEEIHKTRVSVVPRPLSCKRPSPCPRSAETQWAHKAKEFSNREADNNPSVYTDDWVSGSAENILSFGTITRSQRK